MPHPHIPRNLQSVPSLASVRWTSNLWNTLHDKSISVYLRPQTGQMVHANSVTYGEHLFCFVILNISKMRWDMLLQFDLCWGWRPSD